MPQRVGSAAHGTAARAFIAGAAALPLNPQPPQSPLHLMAAAVRQALQDAGLALHQVTGLVASPSLAPGLSFMPAHQLATHLGLLPARQPAAATSARDNCARELTQGLGAPAWAGTKSEAPGAAAASPAGPGEATTVKGVAVHRPGAVAAAQTAGRRFTATSINTCGASPVSGQSSLAARAVCVTTLDVGGASPIAGLALARRMIQCDGHSVVIVAAADAVASMPRREFLALADAACQSPNPDHAVPSPVIPNAYDTVARWEMGRVQEGSSSGDCSGGGGGSGSGSGGSGSSSGSGGIGGSGGGRHSSGGSVGDGGSGDGGGNSHSSSSGGGCDGAGRLTRRQLAMCASLMSLQASRHPNALTKRPLTVEDILTSPAVAPCTTVLECAKRADGGGAVVVVSEAVWRASCASGSAAQPQQQLQQPQRQLQQQPQPSQHLRQHSQECDHVVAVEVLGTGEASGPIFPPPIAEMEEGTFASCRQAVETAAAEAGMSTQQLPTVIDYWGLYDCFPICLVRAIEAVGLAARGQGGAYVERAYTQLLPHFLEAQVHTPGGEWSLGHHGGVAPSPGVPRRSIPGRLLQATATTTAAEPQPVREPCSVFPINTHGGLLGQGAPWEAPAMYSLVEAVQQLRWQAHGRQVQGTRTALVYGNGGVFSASAVAILQRVAADRPSDQAVASKL